MTLDNVFPGNSEMARRMRQLDWSRTPLGPVEAWSQALRTSVSTCLECAFPIVLWWGPELAILYNDEYRPILGPAKHPAALGERGATVWAEIWDVIGPMLSRVMERAEATRSRDLLLHIDRGYPEEAYFSFSYSPIHDDDGGVRGIFCPVIETTERVIGERRLRTLRDLAASGKGAESEAAAYQCVTEVLAANPQDVPFAIIYRVDPAQSVALLEAAVGIEPGTSAAPRAVPLEKDAPGPWSLGTVARSGRAEVISGLAERFTALPTGAWKVPPHTALVLPVLLPGQELPRAILVAPVSPMRALDADHRTFFELVATQIASALADAQALEEERRRAEALAEIDRAKTAFFSNVSHEFRTPLTLMLGPLEEEMRENPSARERLDLAHRNSLRLLKLVNTLLDFSRFEAGRIDASYEPIDLAAFTADVAAVFRSAVEKAGLRLVVDCHPLPEPVYVDREMWEKIVLNLLSNAFKFTLDGEIEVSLRWAGEHVQLAVRDTGVGIAEVDLPRMFQRFHRIRNARSRTHEGTGIGLALVRELARLHGGDVTVDSTQGQGSTFTVSIRTGSAHLPPERINAARQLAATTVEAASFVQEALRWLPQAGERLAMGRHETSREFSEGLPAPARPAVAPSARVFLVDDNADMRDYVGRLLARTYAVEIFADGQAALERINVDPPDLVLADVMMPRLDGFGLLHALRADERTRSLPVILLSARAGEEAVIEGHQAGADAYLTKPFSARELLGRVAAQLELARLRRDTENALRYRSTQYQTLLDQAPVGVYVVDADFRIRDVNPVALPFFGTVPGGVVGRDFAEVIHMVWDTAYADELVRIFRHTLESGEPYIAPERGEFRRDRRVVEYYEWRLDRIMLPDGRYGVVCYFRDISEQVQSRKAIEDSREALRDADRRKDEFLAMLAHELRNPLGALVSAARLLDVDGQSEVDAQRIRAVMGRQLDHLTHLVDDLLEVSRVITGQVRLQRRPLDFARAVNAAVEALRARGALDRHRVTVDAGEPVWVDADETRIEQIVTNLLGNALKFTPRGGSIALEVRARGSQVTFSVTDSGVGIPAEALPRIFDLFAQGERTLDRSEGGLGIGLTLVRRLVELHGGTIEARSDGLDRGSVFSVRLPAIASPVAATMDVSAPERSPESSSAPRRRVLIVEDNDDARDMLRFLLEHRGHTVSVAADGHDGIEHALRTMPDVALIDIGLPGLDGYEVARRIRSADPGRRIALVALTGYGLPDDRRRAASAGFNFHLVKPVDPELLFALLASIDPMPMTA